MPPCMLRPSSPLCKGQSREAIQSYQTSRFFFCRAVRRHLSCKYLCRSCRTSLNYAIDFTSASLIGQTCALAKMLRPHDAPTNSEQNLRIQTLLTGKSSRLQARTSGAACLAPCCSAAAGHGCRRRSEKRKKQRSGIEYGWRKRGSTMM